MDQDQDQDYDQINQLDSETANRIISQLEKAIEDRDDTIAEVKNDNLELQDNWADMRLEYETQIETLQAEITSSRMQHTELKALYDDAKERLQELDGNEHEIENARNERNDAILQLQTVEREYRAMTDDVGMLHNENEQLRSNFTDAQSNVSKLQTTLVTMKKGKREYETRLSKIIQDSQLREEALHSEIADLEKQVDEISTTTDNLRHGMMQAEQDKMKMQNDFTTATMDLLTDDLNAGNRHADRQSSMRLSTITSEDTKPRGRGRSDSQYSVLSDADDTHGRNSSVQFAGRMASGSIAVNDDSLLDEMKNRFHDRTESNVSIDSEAGGGAGHHLRHSRQLSIGATSDAVLQKLRVFLSRELIGQVKTMLGEELKNIDIKEQLDGVPEKLEKLLKQVLENQNEMKTGGSSLNEESLNKILVQFENTVTNSLTETLSKANENQNNAEEIKNALNEALDDIRTKLDTPSESLKTAMEDTMSMQMTALQVSMENQFESAINTSVQQSMSGTVGKDLTSIITKKVGQPLETIHETVEKIYELQMEMSENGVKKKKKGDDEDADSENELSMKGKKGYSMMIDELGGKMEELLGDSMEDSMQQRMDKFMETFRKEVIPEFQAMFDEIDGSSDNKNKGSSSDDEKYDENKNEYETRIQTLQDRIAEMIEEQQQLTADVREAATSKTGSLLRLQNLIDHLRFDNRVLQQRLDRYRLQEAIVQEAENNAKSSWMGGMLSGFGGFGGFGGNRTIQVNVSNMDMSNVASASNAAAEYTANAAVNVVAHAVSAGVNGQNVST